MCASVQVGTTRHGLNMDAVGRVAVAIKRMAERTADEGGFAAAKFVVFMNQPDDNPFMAGAIHGLGQPDAVINIGVSGPGVIARADRAPARAGRRRRRSCRTSPRRSSARRSASPAPAS